MSNSSWENGTLRPSTMFADLLINLPADMPSTVVAAVVTPSEMEIEVIGAAGPTEDTLYEIGSIT